MAELVKKIITIGEKREKKKKTAPVGIEEAEQRRAPFSVRHVPLRAVAGLIGTPPTNNEQQRRWPHLHLRRAEKRLKCFQSATNV